MPRIPREEHLDSSLALMRDPYRYISRTCRRFGTDLFQTRLLLRKMICMTGPEAATLFYDTGRFYRHGAPPGLIRNTLFGKSGVQGLDDAAHRHRKAMFMSLMNPPRVAELGEMTAGVWERQLRQWQSQPQVVLYDQMRQIITHAVCLWAGVPLEEPELPLRTAELTALFDYAGNIGPKHWWSRMSRTAANGWAGQVIEEVRAKRLCPPEPSAAHVIATHRDLDGQLLDPHVAAVELLNVLRPTVAVAVFVTFVAHALHEYPESRQKLGAREEGYDELFVQEVRRFYPFFPSVLARVRHDFEWKGYPFEKDMTVVLDLYGTDHDPRTWDAPEQFRPERFRTWDGGSYNFIPQGGGNPDVNHRCPGEPIAIELMKVALEFLVNRLRYEPPPQDLRVDYTRLPALPRSRFVMRNVQIA